MSVGVVESNVPAIVDSQVPEGFDATVLESTLSRASMFVPVSKQLRVLVGREYDLIINAPAIHIIRILRSESHTAFSS
jgi:hypothetical protein